MHNSKVIGLLINSTLKIYRKKRMDLSIEQSVTIRYSYNLSMFYLASTEKG